MHSAPRHTERGLGDAEVREYFALTRTAFPDQRNKPLALHHGDDAVIVEFLLAGTHLGSFRGLPATGHAARHSSAAAPAEHC